MVIYTKDNKVHFVLMLLQASDKELQQLDGNMRIKDEKVFSETNILLYQNFHTLGLG